MSYNCDSSLYIRGWLYITADKALEFLKKYENKLPERHCLQDIDARDYRILLLPSFWSGECSGRSIHLFEELLKLTTGEAEIVLVWEGGDSFSGCHVKDGVITKKKVGFLLL